MLSRWLAARHRPALKAAAFAAWLRDLLVRAQPAPDALPCAHLPDDVRLHQSVVVCLQPVQQSLAKLGSAGQPIQSLHSSVA